MKIGQYFYIAEIVQTVDRPVQYLFQDPPIQKEYGGCTAHYGGLANSGTITWSTGMTFLGAIAALT
jgi:hypothetical protein